MQQVHSEQNIFVSGVAHCSLIENCFSSGTRSQLFSPGFPLYILGACKTCLFQNSLYMRPKKQSHQFINVVEMFICPPLKTDIWLTLLKMTCLSRLLSQLSFVCDTLVGMLKLGPIRLVFIHLSLHQCLCHE